MPKTTYLGRPAFTLENEHLRVTVTEEGGHIAEVFSKAANINPLWTPHWAGGDPSTFGPQHEATFGSGVDNTLLFGILGHNLCLDLFGGPSAGEAAAGMTAHGEASILKYDITEDGNTMTCKLHMPLAALDFVRTLTLQSQDVVIHETVTNRTAFDRPIGWTQHVTLSPPYLDPKTTQFRMTADRAVVIEEDLGEAPYLAAGKKFAWPHAPLADGSGTHNLQQMSPNTPASSYTAVRMVPQAKTVSWTAWSPASRFAISYVWNPAEFPWLGIWEENKSRSHSPWNNQGVTRGMEFGVSPFPESRQAMTERVRLLDIPTFKWLPGNGTLTAKYFIRTAVTDSIPEMVGSPE